MAEENRDVMHQKLLFNCTVICSFVSNSILYNIDINKFFFIKRINPTFLAITEKFITVEKCRKKYFLKIFSLLVIYFYSQIFQSRLISQSSKPWKWVFATNSSVLILISLQPVDLNFSNFKLWLFDNLQFELSKVYDKGL